MGKVTKAIEHLTIEEIDEKIKSTVGFWRIKRWMVIRHALVNPCSAKEIALNTGLAEQSVHNLICAYNRNGVEAVEVKGRGQRQSAKLTIAEEIEFLNPFFEKAEKGQITEVKEIKDKFDERVGKKVAESTIYRLLKRHGWRKIVPRPTHPKTNKEEQEAFKKTLKIK
ncbi:MAG: winged helix-turn-helix domain-containing protein [Candidatus Gastranaerophilales bacterium]|nr:winged helix-turn-helix domain-containing protein [Candidatus Gastranaerophilales bacterium]